MIKTLIFFVIIIAVLGALGKAIQLIVIGAIERAQEINKDKRFISARKKLHNQKDI